MREMTLQRARLHEAGREGSRTHFARGLDALPDAEVADDPGEQETQGQLPAQAAQVLDARADAQNTSPAEEGWGGVTPPGEAEGAAIRLLCHHRLS